MEQIKQVRPINLEIEQESGWHYSLEPTLIPYPEWMWKGVRPDAKQHLLGSMRSLERGQPTSPTFKLGGDDSVAIALDFMARVKSEFGDQVPAWQYEYELSRTSKWGPQGGHAPWSELRDDFELYYSRPQCIIASKYQYWTDHTPEDATSRKYYGLNAQKLPLDGTLAHLVAKDKIQSRASGWRDFDLKKTDDVAMANALADASSGFWKHGYGYVFSRFNKLKKRLFFPMPFSDMLLEAQYYTTFLEAIQEDLRRRKSDSMYIFWADKIGFDPMFRDIVSPLCKGFDPSHLVFVQRDFEKMDTTSGWSQTSSFFLPALCRGLGIKEGTSEYKRLREILFFGASCPIVTPDGMWLGQRGKPSGANTTNGDETVCNEAYDYLLSCILYQYTLKANVGYEKIASFGNGDDGLSIFYLYHLEDLPAFKKMIGEAADLAAHICGYRVQGSKWLIDTTHGLYCQRMVAPRNGEIWNAYPAVLILNSIVNPEHQYSPAAWDKDYRDLDIIEKLDNGANLQYFNLLIDYVDRKMKYGLLGRTEPELRRIVSKWEAYKVLRRDPFNWRDPLAQESITNSPTLRYLLEKRRFTLG